MLHISVIRQNGTNSKLIGIEWFSKRTMSLYSANFREDGRRSCEKYDWNIWTLPFYRLPGSFDSIIERLLFLSLFVSNENAMERDDRKLLYETMPI